MRWWTQTMKYTLLCIALVSSILFLNLKILHLSFIPSESMEPTIPAGSIVVGTRYDKSNIDRYDIVTFIQDDTILIKRVIGLPGEKLIIEDGNIYANGKLLKNLYIKEKMITEDATIDIPKDSIFVMGDNRNHSYDSRKYGSINIEKVLSKSKLLILPRIEVFNVR